MVACEGKWGKDAMLSDGQPHTPTSEEMPISLVDSIEQEEVMRCVRMPPLHNYPCRRTPGYCKAKVRLVGDSDMVVRPNLVVGHKKYFICFAGK